MAITQQRVTRLTSCLVLGWCFFSKDGLALFNLTAHELHELYYDRPTSERGLNMWHSEGTAPGGSQEGLAKMGVIRGHQTSHDFLGRQHCSPPRASITLATPASAINSNTARCTSAKFCTQSCVVVVPVKKNGLGLLSLVHSNSPKIISIRFDSRQKIDSNRFSSTVAAVDL